MGTTYEDIAEEMSLEDDYLYKISGKALNDAIEAGLSDAIHDSIQERIYTYYLDSHGLFLPVYNAFNNAKSHLNFSPTSTVIYCGIAQEILIKDVLFKPLIYGLVNNETATEIIGEYMFGNKSPFLLKKMNKIVLELTKIDFHTHKRRNSKTNLWDEMNKLREKRNVAVHQGEQFLKTDAQKAYSLVHYLYKLVTKQVLSKYSLVAVKGVIQTEKKK